MEPCLGAYDGRSVGLVTSVRRTARPRPLTGLTPSGTDDGPAAGRPRRAAGRGPGCGLRRVASKSRATNSDTYRAARARALTRQSVFQARGLFQAFSRASVIAQHAEQVRLPAFNRSFVIRQPRTGRGRASDTVKT